eukprot:gnl/Chilomastix_cuspidata/791.p1 GENE.gnl/Chilomastix_cuspidata/791~~gnl/Chilomastix_cuspidata/791.p1  ORF type:complete len:548 (+),score=251.53 gnl/Chilomastix_cuspidata/791:34-1644(+)
MPETVPAGHPTPSTTVLRCPEHGVQCNKYCLSTHTLICSRCRPNKLHKILDLAKTGKKSLPTSTSIAEAHKKLVDLSGAAIEQAKFALGVLLDQKSYYEKQLSRLPQNRDETQKVVICDQEISILDDLVAKLDEYYQHFHAPCLRSMTEDAKQKLQVANKARKEIQTLEARSAALRAELAELAPEIRRAEERVRRFECAPALDVRQRDGMRALVALTLDLAALAGDRPVARYVGFPQAIGNRLVQHAAGLPTQEVHGVGFSDVVDIPFIPSFSSLTDKFAVSTGGHLAILSSETGRLYLYDLTPNAMHAHASAAQPHRAVSFSVMYRRAILAFAGTRLCLAPTDSASVFYAEAEALFDAPRFETFSRRAIPEVKEDLALTSLAPWSGVIAYKTFRAVVQLDLRTFVARKVCGLLNVCSLVDQAGASVPGFGCFLCQSADEGKRCIAISGGKDTPLDFLPTAATISTVVPSEGAPHDLARALWIDTRNNLYRGGEEFAFPAHFMPRKEQVFARVLRNVFLSFNSYSGNCCLIKIVVP